MSKGTSDVAALCREAFAKVEALEIEEAATLFKKALEKDPKSIVALNGLADICFNTGDGEGAAAALSKSVKLSPEGQPERYMNLAQLADDGATALSWLDKGVAIMRAVIGTVIVTPIRSVTTVVSSSHEPFAFLCCLVSRYQA